jgi:hypothetical protein
MMSLNAKLDCYSCPSFTLAYLLNLSFQLLNRISCGLDWRMALIVFIYFASLRTTFYFTMAFSDTTLYTTTCFRPLHYMFDMKIRVIVCFDPNDPECCRFATFVHAP